MNYTVLSRKWRPQLFTQVVGQNHVTEALQNAVNLNRVAHAYIFCGPRGVGKTTIARILSKTVNCINQIKANPCNECSNCNEITAGSNLDVLEFDGASNRGIDEIRDLRESVKYPPNSGKYKVFIIDEVHMLTKEAFNALLKTLEEPPSHVIFIFATTDPHKVPQTILSRTQRYDLKRISYQLIINHLTNILDDEKISYEIDALSYISKKSEGSLRDALSLLDQIIAYSNNKVSNECAKDILGIVDEAVYFDLMNYLLNKNPLKTTRILKDSIDSGISIHDFIDGYISFIRSCILIYNGYVNDDDFLSNDCIQKIKASNFLNSEKMINMLDSLINTKIKVKNFQQPYIAYETLFLKLSSNNGSDIKNISSSSIDDYGKGLTDYPKVKEKSVNADILKSKNFSADKKLLSVEAEMQTKEVDRSIKKDIKKIDNGNSFEQQSSNKSLTLKISDIESKWNDVIRLVDKENPKVAQFIDQVNILDVNEESIIIQLIDGHSFHIDALEKDTILVEDAFSQIFKLNLKISYKIKEKTKEIEIKKENENNESEEHPLFVKAIEDFDGELLR